jgi:hypothetical protein
MPQKTEKTSVWLYAVLDRDFDDFFEFVAEEQDDEALKLLYLMLTTPNDKHDEQTTKLNNIGGGIVKRQLESRSLDLPERPYPTAWERILNG